MNDRKLLDEIEHISDIFTRILMKTLTVDASEEITESQFQALRHISHHGPSTVGGMAEGLSISQPAATMLVDRMAKRGLVERQTGRSDRRQAEVSLSPRAEELISSMESERAERLREILSLMTEEERQELAKSLEIFVGAALKVSTPIKEACLRCGIEHRSGCIVNRSNIERAGHEVDHT